MRDLELLKFHRVVPAQPGWNVLVQIHNESGAIDGVDRWPVIAWGIRIDFVKEEAAYFSIPITVDTLPQNDWEWAFEAPGGKIFIPDHCEFEDEPDLIAHWERERVQAEQRKRNKRGLN